MGSRQQRWGIQGDIRWGGALVRKPYWLSKQTTSQSYKVGNEGRHFKCAEMAGIWDPKIYPSLQKSLLIDDNHYDGLKDVCSLLWIPLPRLSLIFLFSVPWCIWTTRGDHLPSRRVFLYALLGTQRWPVHLRLSHGGHSLVDKSGYLLNITSYSANIRNRNA